MKILAAFSLLVLIVVPAKAQQQSPQPAPPSIETELLELEQDVDKTLLREAMLRLGRKGLRPSSERPTSVVAARMEEEDAQALPVYIETKRKDIVARSNRLKEAKAEARRGTRPASAAPKPTAASQDPSQLSDKMESAQVEAQLLQTQVNMYQGPLTEAINALAAAELAASVDKNQQPKVDAARKEYDTVKSRFVDVSKRLRTEQGKLNEMYQAAGMGGMVGMGGGMGGGMR